MISGHMQHRSIAIISPYRYANTVDDNRAAFAQMRDRLRHLGSIRIRARYSCHDRTRDEQAFLVFGRAGRDHTHLTAMRKLAFDFGQKALLVRSGDESDAFFHHADGTVEGVGSLTPNRLTALYARLRSTEHDGFYTSVEFFRPVSVFRRTEIVLSPEEVCAEIEAQVGRVAA